MSQTGASLGTPPTSKQRGSVGAWLRIRWLIQQMELHGAVATTEAAKQLRVTPMTVRRDMAWLATHYRYTRVHGGLVGGRVANDPYLHEGHRQEAASARPVL